MLHMEQNTSFEIIDILLKKREHARNISRRLNTNHMTINRKLNILQKNNFIDYNQEGKNKVYFLKKSIEAKNYVYMTESYKLIKKIDLYPRLRKIINKIIEYDKVSLAVLFGSYAKNTSSKNSDIDIYIETEDKPIKNYFEKIDSKLSIKIGTYDKNSNLIKEIENNHVIIKGIESYYEKNKFFEQII
ncbi:hypothetical protein HOD20_03220 [archaeon]|jgi:predicted nucleotidyltransferase|nr:hypothetical protein [archaeon]MBT4351513.1 hypothetical protein [archaeon]MBT4648634.1 hypothetical protein [archaeon]MBT6822499.1 hypothetical protein [archaeon]MBT7392173.1 hypothetical protein [archaeon]